MHASRDEHGRVGYASNEEEDSVAGLIERMSLVIKSKLNKPSTGRRTWPRRWTTPASSSASCSRTSRGSRTSRLQERASAPDRQAGAEPGQAGLRRDAVAAGREVCVPRSKEDARATAAPGSRRADRAARPAAAEARSVREAAGREDRGLPVAEGGHQGAVLGRRGAGPDRRGGDRDRRADGRHGARRSSGCATRRSRCRLGRRRSTS